MVRTPASQAGNAGSIPVICSRLIYGYSSMVEQRSPKPLTWVQLLLSVPWSHSSVGRAKDWNFLWRWFNSSWDHHFLTINCLCGDFRHATVFLIFKDKTIQPARLSFQAKVQYRKHEPVHHKKQGDGGSLHTARSSEVRAIFEQCDALARIGCDVVLFILFNISAIGMVPICCFRVSLPLLNHMRSMTMSLNRIGLSKPKASGSS